MRLQLALNVANLDRAIDYYGRLFATRPHKVRPGYANFAIEEPPLKLVLFENGSEQRINHLGVEVTTQEEFDRSAARLSADGLVDRAEDDATCCHATMDKVWSSEPDGLAWEWYRITDDTPAANNADCCRD